MLDRITKGLSAAMAFVLRSLKAALGQAALSDTCRLEISDTFLGLFPKTAGGIH